MGSHSKGSFHFNGMSLRFWPLLGATLVAMAMAG
jgi:hypothetical protein